MRPILFVRELIIGLRLGKARQGSTSSSFQAGRVGGGATLSTLVSPARVTSLLCSGAAGGRGDSPVGDTNKRVGTSDLIIRYLRHHSFAFFVSRVLVSLPLLGNNATNNDRTAAVDVVRLLSSAVHPHTVQ